MVCECLNFYINYTQPSVTNIAPGFVLVSTFFINPIHIPSCMSKRGLFHGKVGFIIATSASAVGLGNIWRFPTEAASNGGGTFLIVYLISVLIFGLTMMMTEIAIGRKTQASPVEAYTQLHPKSRFIGILSAMVPAIILPYYCVIGGWLLGYLIGYCTGMDMSAGDTFVNYSSSYYSLFGFLLFALLMAAVVYKGVSKGIERISVIFMPVFLMLLGALTVYMLLQPDIGDGLAYYLEFHSDHIDGDMLLAALGQAFFSLSIAMGILITYGSYMSKKESIENCSITIIIIDTLVAVVAGLLIVPIAFQYTGGDMTGGAGLVFITLPQIFDGMRTGLIIAIVFFVMISFAALTSAVSIIEAVSSTIMDSFDAPRHRVVLFVLGVTVVVGMCISLGYGPLDFIQINGNNLLDIFDYISNSILMPVVAILMCILIGHVVGPKVIVDEVESSGPFRTKILYSLMIKWVCPLLVAVILLKSIGII